MLIMVLVVPAAALVMVLALAKLEAALLDGGDRSAPAPGESDKPARKPTPTGGAGEHPAAGDH